VQTLPQALTGPLAGVINDRLRRKSVMIFSDLARACIIACILLVRSPGMIWLVYPLLAMETVMWGLFEPARNAIIPNIVGEDEVILANTLSATTWSMNLFLGGAIGGLVAAFLGRDVVFVLDALSFLGSAALIRKMSFGEPHSEGRPPLRWRDLVNFTDVREGWRYIRNHPSLTPAVFVKAGLGVTGASWVIFTVMGKRIFPVTGFGLSAERGAILGMSFLMGARGIGALIGPLAGAPWAQQRQNRLRLGIFLAFLTYGLGYVLLNFANHAWMAYLIVIPSHMGGAVIWVFSTVLLQLLAEDRFRGRVFSAELSLCTTMLAAGAYFAGMAMDRGVSVRHVCLVTGMFTLLAGTLWGLFGLRARQPEAVAAEVAG
jgi:MFS family permease